MFERYSEQARRALFFARYESSQVGSVSIPDVGRLVVQVGPDLESVKAAIVGA